MKNHILERSWKPLFAVFVWGLSFIATKYALVELKPVVIVFIRQLLGVSLLSVLALKQRRSFAINFRDQKWIALLSLIAAFHLWIQVTGLRYTSASNTGWIIGITPIFMVLLAFFFFKEKIACQQAAGIVISFAGLILLVSKFDLSSIDFISNKGDFLVLASSFTWSVYSLVGKKITIHYPPLMTILYLFLMMALVISPFAISAASINSVLNLSLSGWLAVMFLGIFCSGIAYVLWAQSLSEMPSSKVGAFLYIEPFVTLFGARFFLNEPISLLTLLSGIIIIAGVILVNKNN